MKVEAAIKIANRESIIGFELITEEAVKEYYKDKEKFVKAVVTHHLEVLSYDENIK